MLACLLLLWMPWRFHFSLFSCCVHQWPLARFSRAALLLMHRHPHRGFIAYYLPSSFPITALLLKAECIPERLLTADPLFMPQPRPNLFPEPGADARSSRHNRTALHSKRMASPSRSPMPPQRPMSPARATQQRAMDKANRFP